MATPLRNIRVDDETWTAWKTEAKRRGLTVTDWTIANNNSSMPGGVAPVAAGQDDTQSKVATKPRAAGATASRGAQPPVPPVPLAERAKRSKAAREATSCPHPKGKREQLGYAVKCGACGEILPRS